MSSQRNQDRSRQAGSFTESEESKKWVHQSSSKSCAEDKVETDCSLTQQEEQRRRRRRKGKEEAEAGEESVSSISVSNSVRDEPQDVEEGKDPTKKKKKKRRKKKDGRQEDSGEETKELPVKMIRLEDDGPTTGPSSVVENPRVGYDFGGHSKTYPFNKTMTQNVWEKKAQSQILLSEHSGNRDTHQCSPRDETSAAVPNPQLLKDSKDAETSPKKKRRRNRKEPDRDSCEENKTAFSGNTQNLESSAADSLGESCENFSRISNTTDKTSVDGAVESDASRIVQESTSETSIINELCQKQHLKQYISEEVPGSDLPNLESSVDLGDYIPHSDFPLRKPSSTCIYKQEIGSCKLLVRKEGSARLIARESISDDDKWAFMKKERIPETLDLVMEELGTFDASSIQLEDVYQRENSFINDVKQNLASDDMYLMQNLLNSPEKRSKPEEQNQILQNQEVKGSGEGAQCEEDQSNKTEGHCDPEPIVVAKFVGKGDALSPDDFDNDNSETIGKTAAVKPVTDAHSKLERVVWDLGCTETIVGHVEVQEVEVEAGETEDQNMGDVQIEASPTVFSTSVENVTIFETVSSQEPSPLVNETYRQVVADLIGETQVSSIISSRGRSFGVAQDTVGISQVEQPPFKKEPEQTQTTLVTGGKEVNNPPVSDAGTTNEELNSKRISTCEEKGEKLNQSQESSKETQQAPQEISSEVTDSKQSSEDPELKSKSCLKFESNGSETTKHSVSDKDNNGTEEGAQANEPSYLSFEDRSTKLRTTETKSEHQEKLHEGGSKDRLVSENDVDGAEEDPKSQTYLAESHSQQVTEDEESEEIDEASNTGYHDIYSDSSVVCSAQSNIKQSKTGKKEESIILEQICGSAVSVVKEELEETETVLTNEVIAAEPSVTDESSKISVQYSERELQQSLAQVEEIFSEGLMNKIIQSNNSSENSINPVSTEMSPNKLISEEQSEASDELSLEDQVNTMICDLIDESGIGDVSDITAGLEGQRPIYGDGVHQDALIYFDSSTEIDHLESSEGQLESGADVHGITKNQSDTQLVTDSSYIEALTKPDNSLPTISTNGDNKMNVFSLFMGVKTVPITTDLESVDPKTKSDSDVNRESSNFGHPSISLPSMTNGCSTAAENVEEVQESVEQVKKISSIDEMNHLTEELKKMVSNKEILYKASCSYQEAPPEEEKTNVTSDTQEEEVNNDFMFGEIDYDEGIGVEESIPSLSSDEGYNMTDVTLQKNLAGKEEMIRVDEGRASTSKNAEYEYVGESSGCQGKVLGVVENIRTLSDYSDDSIDDNMVVNKMLNQSGPRMVRSFNTISRFDRTVSKRSDCPEDKGSPINKDTQETSLLGNLGQMSSSSTDSKEPVREAIHSTESFTHNNLSHSMQNYYNYSDVEKISETEEEETVLRSSVLDDTLTSDEVPTSMSGDIFELITKKKENQSHHNQTSKQLIGKEIFVHNHEKELSISDGSEEFKEPSSDSNKKYSDNQPIGILKVETAEENSAIEEGRDVGNPTIQNVEQHWSASNSKPAYYTEIPAGDVDNRVDEKIQTSDGSSFLQDFRSRSRHHTWYHMPTEEDITRMGLQLIGNILFSRKENQTGDNSVLGNASTTASIYSQADEKDTPNGLEGSTNSDLSDLIDTNLLGDVSYGAIAVNCLSGQECPEPNSFTCLIHSGDAPNELPAYSTFLEQEPLTQEVIVRTVSDIREIEEIGAFRAEETNVDTPFDADTAQCSTTVSCSNPEVAKEPNLPGGGCKYDQTPCINMNDPAHLDSSGVAVREPAKLTVSLSNTVDQSPSFPELKNLGSTKHYDSTPCINLAGDTLLKSSDVSREIEIADEGLEDERNSSQIKVEQEGKQLDKVENKGYDEANSNPKVVLMDSCVSYSQTQNITVAADSVSDEIPLGQGPQDGYYTRYTISNDEALSIEEKMSSLILNTFDTALKDDQTGNTKDLPNGNDSASEIPNVSKVATEVVKSELDLLINELPPQGDPSESNFTDKCLDVPSDELPPQIEESECCFNGKYYSPYRGKIVSKVSDHHSNLSDRPPSNQPDDNVSQNILSSSTDLLVTENVDSCPPPSQVSVNTVEKRNEKSAAAEDDDAVGKMMMMLAFNLDGIRMNASNQEALNSEAVCLSAPNESTLLETRSELLIVNDHDHHKRVISSCTCFSSSKEGVSPESPCAVEIGSNIRRTLTGKLETEKSQQVEEVTSTEEEIMSVKIITVDDSIVEKTEDSRVFEASHQIVTTPAFPGHSKHSNESLEKMKAKAGVALQDTADDIEVIEVIFENGFDSPLSTSPEVTKKSLKKRASTLFWAKSKKGKKKSKHDQIPDNINRVFMNNTGVLKESCDTGLFASADPPSGLRPSQSLMTDSELARHLVPPSKTLWARIKKAFRRKVR